MKVPIGPRKWKEPVPAPGDDIVPVPPPVEEDPPHDSFCDLVLTGGVASGVVYPWAIVELARVYRFRNIGGTSVGAMAAALAAAAEYGRRCGCEAPFEVLRRAPASLASTMSDGRTRMLSLFQPNKHGRRLIWLWGRLARGNEGRTLDESRCPRRFRVLRAVLLTLRSYKGFIALGGAVPGFIGLAICCALRHWTVPAIMLIVVSVVLAGVLGGLWGLWHDIRHGLIANFYGLCKGSTFEKPGGPTGLSDWLHDGIQRSAGLKEDEPPLTFRDLWNAPPYPGGQRRPCGPDDPPDRRSINLQMFTTNVTHGRPYRLPLADRTSRLFFRRQELEGYFPTCVLDALVRASKPYAPQRTNDPPLREDNKALYELPEEDLPVVVAARLSLSFPLLFSAVPLWAIDHEAPPGQRTLRRCIFTDGGASSNFPIHLFDAAVPRWPTFGLWLDRRSPYFRKDPDAPDTEEEVWLPEFNGQGWGDNWNRFDPESRPGPPPDGCPDARKVVRCRDHAAGNCRSHAQMLAGFLVGIATSATDWRDRTSFRLPHVRNRVARMLLLPGEGGLHIGMPREQILEMAHRYGTRAGQKFVERFAERDGEPSRAWLEQRWIRFNLLINGLRERLDGLATSSQWSGHSWPLERAIERAAHPPGPVANHAHCHQIDQKHADSLTMLLAELDRLEKALRNTSAAFHSPPEPELRLRPPL